MTKNLIKTSVFILSFVFSCFGVTHNVNAQVVPSIEVTSWKPAYQSNGSVINAGEITLTLKDYSGVTFPGTGTVNAATADGNVIPVSTVWIRNPLDNTWVWKMYIPGTDPIRFYNHLYMDQTGLNIPVSWIGYGPWETDSTNTGVMLSEYITNPDTSVTLFRTAKSSNQVFFNYSMTHNPTWVSYPFNNVKIKFNNPTCKVQKELDLTGYVNNGVDTKFAISYLRSEIFPGRYTDATWTLVFTSLSGTETVWDTGTTQMPICVSKPTEIIRR